MMEIKDEHQPIEFYEGMEIPGHLRSSKSEMSRGTQTAWIVAAILLVGAVIVFIATRPKPMPGDPYAECYKWWGKDTDCTVKKFVQRYGY